MEFSNFIDNVSKKTEGFVEENFDIKVSEIIKGAKYQTKELLSDINLSKVESNLLGLINDIDFEQISTDIQKLGLNQKVETIYNLFNSKINQIIPYLNGIIDYRGSSLSIFKKSKKGEMFLNYIKAYSSISVEKLYSIIEESSNNFNISKSSIVSILVGEFNPALKKSPFKSNKKGIGQFTETTFGDFINGHISKYFEHKGLKIYANNLELLNITDLNDRSDPYKSINAIAAYLKYIEVIVEAKNIPKEYIVAMYNVGHNGKTTNHLQNNPAVAEIYNQLYPNKVVNTQRLLHAASVYYKQYG